MPPEASGLGVKGIADYHGTLRALSLRPGAKLAEPISTVEARMGWIANGEHAKTYGLISPYGS
tara:strand:- start:239 stop:427 length:189 start_codon:yes stop_codon:yes gene_type:complete